jgi:hypothetical protein
VATAAALSQRLGTGVTPAEAPALWKAASGISQRYNPFPMVIGFEPAKVAVREQARQAVFEVAVALRGAGGLPAAVQRAKELGRDRGVRPSTGALGGTRDNATVTLRRQLRPQRDGFGGNIVPAVRRALEGTPVDTTELHALLSRLSGGAGRDPIAVALLEQDYREQAGQTLRDALDVAVTEGRLPAPDRARILDLLVPRLRGQNPLDAGQHDSADRDDSADEEDSVDENDSVAGRDSVDEEDSVDAETGGDGATGDATEQAVSYREDYSAFETVYDQAVARIAKGEQPVPYFYDNATGGRPTDRR